MDDPTRPTARVLRISRGAEPSRLSKHAFPAAYQRVVPIQRRTLPKPGPQVDADASNPLPRRAAGE
jgi:hypothetical protein